MSNVGVNIGGGLNGDADLLGSVFALGEEGFGVEEFAVVANVELFEFANRLYGLME